jgi:pimeloyl-ACP methyl ester carboxylesterase
MEVWERILSMLEWSDGYLNSNHKKIHYCRTGGDKPPLILNHGATDDGLCWTRVAVELESDFDVIMLDARGHGLSDSGDGDYTSMSRAADLAGVIQTLELNKPVVGGHSMGADTAMYLAANHPDLVRAIFLEDPPIPPPGEPLFGGEAGEKFEEAGKTFMRIMRVFKVMPLFLGKLLARKMMPTSPDEEITPWLMSKKRLNPDFLNMQDSSSFFNADSPLDILGKITVPILLIIGDRDLGSIVSQGMAREISKAVPDLKVAYHAGANHDIRRAKFDAYIQTLKAFLAEVY